MKGKAFALAGAAGAFVLAGAAPAAFTGMTVVDVPSLPGMRTIQLRAQFDNPADQLLAIGAIPGLGGLAFNNTHALYNDDFQTGLRVNDFPHSPLGDAFDSHVQINQSLIIGGDTQLTPGFAGVPATDSAIAGTSWSEDDGGWFDNDPGTAVTGTDLMVARFTFDAAATGSLVGLVNYIPAGGGPGFVSDPFEAGWVPAPGALALLGLAGLAGARRRRR